MGKHTLPDCLKTGDYRVEQYFDGLLESIGPWFARHSLVANLGALMLIARYNPINPEDRPGNHFLAQKSHEATVRSLMGLPVVVETEFVETVSSTMIAQDPVDEAAMESFPASDPPSYGSVHV